MGGPAPIVHFELGVRDAARARAFYGPLLGWEFADYNGSSMVKNIGPMAPPQSGGPGGGCVSGIGGHISAHGHEPSTYCILYAQVDDIDAKVAQAEKLGGRKIVPRTEVPGIGHFAWITDPEGNMVGLWKPMIAR
ncbi:MAG TPA: VOC family protein [Phycisphaerales bacterium]|nr:VOC family protein [Phycisphaerales bacterium]